MYHTGFYNFETTNRIHEMLRATENPYFDWDSESPYDNAFIFLQGACEDFAMALHQVHGYTICKIMNSDHSFHAFCMKYGCYIDVRGITDSFIEFEQSLIFNYKIDQITLYNTLKVDRDEAKLFANYLIKSFNHYYLK